MRLGIMGQFERKLASGAAILLVGGLSAGCSSQIDRFSEGLMTSSTQSNSTRYASTANQPYPGDASGNVDQTYTGSVAGHNLRPQMPVGNGTVQPQPPYNYNAPSAASAPAYSAPAASAPVSNIQRAPMAPPSGSTSAALPAPSSSAPSAAAQPPRAADGERGASGKTITVRHGETIANLSRRYNVPQDAILAANGMNSASELRSGSSLLIPGYAYSTNSPDKNAGSEQKSPLRTPDGQKAVIAAPGPQNRAEQSSSPSSASANAAPTAGGSYTVASGDTLYGIAQKTGVSVSRLKAANNMSDGSISIGQQLRIPSGGSAGATQVASVEPKAAATAPEPAKPSVAPEKKDEAKTQAYTPPAKSDSVANQVSTEDKEAALPPDSTGIGRLRWPVRGRVVSSFGSGGGNASSDGIDIAVPEGTPVKAAENGVVIYAGDGLKEFGKTVLVRHDDGLVTVYGYTKDIKVNRGDTVKRGQEIATSGMSGSADRPKLHFEVRKDASPVDPTKFLD